MVRRSRLSPFSFSTRAKRQGGPRWLVGYKVRSDATHFWAVLPIEMRFAESPLDWAPSFGLAPHLSLPHLRSIVYKPILYFNISLIEVHCHFKSTIQLDLGKRPQLVCKNE